MSRWRSSETCLDTGAEADRVAGVGRVVGWGVRGLVGGGGGVVGNSDRSESCWGRSLYVRRGPGRGRTCGLGGVFRPFSPLVTGLVMGAPGPVTI